MTRECERSWMQGLGEDGGRGEDDSLMIKATKNYPGWWNPIPALVEK